jgi:hypothetical protein
MTESAVARRLNRESNRAPREIQTIESAAMSDNSRAPVSERSDTLETSPCAVGSDVIDLLRSHTGKAEIDLVDS